MDDTMIVFTSDHGDYLGDHWLGEKELFHEASARIPMIVYDPDTAAEITRGTVDDRLVEAIDLVPTFVDVLGGEVQPHRMEGRSLKPLLRGGLVNWRDAVFSEGDYAWRHARHYLDLSPEEARSFMVRTADWKYIYYENFRPETIACFHCVVASNWNCISLMGQLHMEHHLFPAAKHHLCSVKV